MKIDWSSRVGEVFHERKRLVEFCGIYRPPGGGAKPMFKWECLRCSKVTGPSQYQDIKRFPTTHCCSKSSKYGEARWGYRHITGAYMRGLHGSAVKRGLEFNVSSRYLYDIWQQQGGKCAYTGLDLELVGNRQASVDRIDSSKGYIEGNVQWVLTKVNHMKWDSTEEEFLNLCSIISGRMEKKDE